MQSGSSFRLTMQRGPAPGKNFELVKDVVTVGRDVSNDITINDAEVSRHHARLTRQDDTYTLEDLGSTNGTFINSSRLTGGRPLASGDLVGLGETVILIYQVVAMAEGATAVAPSGGKVTEETLKTQFDASSMPSASPMGAPSMPKPQVQMPRPRPTPATEETYVAVEPRPAASSRTRWIAVGCGCLSLCLCLGVIAAVLWYIVANNLYCQLAPFLFGCP